MKFKEYLFEKKTKKFGLTWEEIPKNSNIFQIILSWDDFLVFTEKNKVTTAKSYFRIKGQMISWEEFEDEDDMFRRKAILTFIQGPTK